MNKSFTVTKLSLGQMAANCYIIENGQHSIVIDPGAEGQKIIDYLQSKQLMVNAVLLTHGHFDHIGAIELLNQEYHCPIYIHEADHDMIYNDQLNLSAYYQPLMIQSDVQQVKDHLKIGDFNITFMNLPGHTKGSCFIVFDDYDMVFSGDVLFKNSIGRYDFPTSSVEDTKSTLKKINQMNIDYHIYPGHGEDTTLYTEKCYNPFFKA